MKIAFVGVGRMGSRMASRLIEAGHELSVYDPFAPAVEALKQQGAAAAGNPAEAAEGAEIIMLSLPSPATFTDAVTGETGILNKVSPGAIVVDFSTVDPATTKDIAALCARKNVYFLDSPVSGGVAGAASGNLVLMIGGSEEVIERVRPVLDVLSSRIVHCGDTGAGQLTKLSHNLLTAINTVALGEVLSVSVKAGADLNVLCEVFQQGWQEAKCSITCQRPSSPKNARLTSPLI